MERNFKTGDIHISKTRIRTYFYMGSLSALVLLVAILSFLYARSLNREYTIKIDQLSTAILMEKKAFLRNAVGRTIFLIENVRKEISNFYQGKNISKEEIDKQTISIITRLIRDLRLINKGYIWVNHILNYQGGNDYAIRLIHPNLPHTEGMYLSTDTKDSVGNRPYEEELSGIVEHGEIFFDYYFKKMSTDNIAHKLSYAKLYKPFDWVVATGIYLDDLDELIATETKKMKASHDRQIMTSMFIASIAFLVSLLIVISFERQINTLILSYENKIKKYTDGLETLSMTDRLTGLYNRQRLDDAFIHELNRGDRYHETFSIILADLDNFKAVNDNYGHQIGDEVLKAVARTFKNCTRSSDTLGRWGGEEFLVICPRTNLEGAELFAQKIRKSVNSLRFDVVKYVSCSFGVSTYRPDDNKKSMIQRADEALYRAKENGRNRVEIEIS